MAPMYIELVKYPDVFLRSESKTVPFPLDDKTERLIKYMSRAMYQHHGIGLAAIQVGYQLRMFVMDVNRSEEKPQVFINPEIIKNKTLTKNMPNVKWKAIPPVRGPNPQGVNDGNVYNLSLIHI